MLLTITTTHRPATDLGYLLGKHPDRLQTFQLGFGEAHVVYPEASDDRCTMALILDLDPISLVRGRPGDASDASGPLASYVNDRPYVASSFLSVAIAKVLGSALGGRTATRAALAESDLPLSATVGPVHSRGGIAVIHKMFAPLGYHVAVTPLPGTDEAGSGLWMLTLQATTRLQTLLSHLYVLIPVLDGDKHYWVAEGEIEKLLRHGEGWLAAHPERELITRRYLRHSPRLGRQALERLDPDSLAPGEPPAPAEEPLALNDLRHQAVLHALQQTGATSVLDLGCGEGRLLRHLLADTRLTRIVGTDISAHTLDIARERLKLDRMPERQRDRLTLLQSPLTYRDRRLKGFDAAAMVEVVEHIDPDRLPAVETAIFAHAKPRTLVLTTPNRDWNASIPALASGTLRHRDHRFEWSRSEFAAWTQHVGETFGYTAEVSGVGAEHPAFGCPTQMAVFRCG